MISIVSMNLFMYICCPPVKPKYLWQTRKKKKDWRCQNLIWNQQHYDLFHPYLTPSTINAQVFPTMIGHSKRYSTSTNSYPNTWLHIEKPPKLCRQQSLIKVTIVEVELLVGGWTKELRGGGPPVLVCWRRWLQTCESRSGKIGIGSQLKISASCCEPMNVNFLFYINADYDLPS